MRECVLSSWFRIIAAATRESAAHEHRCRHRSRASRIVNCFSCLCDYIRGHQCRPRAVKAAKNVMLCEQIDTPRAYVHGSTARHHVWDKPPQQSTNRLSKVASKPIEFTTPRLPVSQLHPNYIPTTSAPPTHPTSSLQSPT